MDTLPLPRHNKLCRLSQVHSPKYKFNKPVFDAHNYDEIDQIVSRLREEMSKFSRLPSLPSPRPDRSMKWTCPGFVEG